MHHHLDESDSAYPDSLEVVRILRPGLLVADVFLCFGPVVVERIAGGVDKLDSVSKL